MLLIQIIVLRLIGSKRLVTAPRHGSLKRKCRRRASIAREARRRFLTNGSIHNLFKRNTNCHHCWLGLWYVIDVLEKDQKNKNITYFS